MPPAQYRGFIYLIELPLFMNTLGTDGSFQNHPLFVKTFISVIHFSGEKR